VELDKKYAYTQISSEGLITWAYILPEMNLTATAYTRDGMYLLSVSGKHLSLFRVGPHGVKRFDYNLDLWSLHPTTTIQQSDSLVFYLPGTWRDHYGVVRIDLSDINAPVARVFYDIPVSDLIRERDNIYFQGLQGYLHELSIRGREATDYRILVKAKPLSAHSGKVGVKSESGAGYVEVSENMANAVILDGKYDGALVTDYATFISSNTGLYAVTGEDKNSLRVYKSTTPFVAYSYFHSPTEYAILGTYASDPAYIHGTFDFPHCPKNFTAIDANVTFVTAPIDRISTVTGILTPINYEGNANVPITPVKLSAEFPCYSP